MGKSQGKSGLGIGIIILIILVFFIIFAVKMNTIKRNLKETQFFDKVFGFTPKTINDYETKENDTGELPGDPLPSPTVTFDLNSKETELDTAPSPFVKEEISSSKEEDSATFLQETSPQSEIAIPPNTATRQAKLYFMSIESDGTISRKLVTRSMPKTKSPLVDSINALIAGPTLEERKTGCKNLISNGTKLLSAKVEDNVAILNFNENFEINNYGVEGLTSQLEQIVFTATSFNTVKSVQFLIEGQHRDYLGSEGVWIGSPLSIDNLM